MISAAEARSMTTNDAYEAEISFCERKIREAAQRGHKRIVHIYTQPEMARDFHEKLTNELKSMDFAVSDYRTSSEGSYVTAILISW